MKGRGSHALTDRELEVAHLAAGGLTRREIATQLAISENSVKTHLEHIYGKLGVRNRIEMEHNLPPRHPLSSVN